MNGEDYCKLNKLILFYFILQYNVETSVLTSYMVDNSSTGGECPFISSIQTGVTAAGSSGQYNASVVQVNI
jgi:hypothetical protein